MAKYQVTHSCGHEQTVVLFGKHTERDRKIQWLETSGLCSECYAAHREAQRKSQTEASATWADTIGLVPLKGSEKQVAWAETLRREKLTVNNRLTDSGLWTILRYETTEQEFLREIAVSQDSDTVLVYADWCDENRTDDRAEKIRLAVETKNDVNKCGIFRDCLRLLSLEAAILRIAVEQEAKWWIDHRSESIYDLAPGGQAEKKELEEAAKQEQVQKKEDKIQAIRDEIRSLFGELVEAKVGEWSGQKRVYLGSYGGPSACYYVNASPRVDAGTFECGLRGKCAEHLGISEDEAREKLKAFCEKLANGWNTLSIR